MDRAHCVTGRLVDRSDACSDVLLPDWSVMIRPDVLKRQDNALHARIRINIDTHDS